jgi:hypothetical protein
MVFIGAPDWINNAIDKINLMHGRDYSQSVNEGLEKILEGFGHEKTKAIVQRLKSYDNLPSNIVGLCERIFAEINGDDRERESWEVRKRDNLGTNEECIALMAFNGELFLWHELGLAERNTEFTHAILDIEQWAQAGRPKTWSKILDHWLIGFEKAYILDKAQAGALLDYLMRYNDMLVKTRKERTKAA